MQDWRHHEAFDFIATLLADETGIGVLHGPPESGKSAVINQLLQTLPPAMAVADIDATGLNSSGLLAEMLAQFGYHAQLDSSDELLNMVRVFSVQQTRTLQAPFVIIRNFNAMYPSALHALCKLSAQQVNGKYAVRVLLVAQHYFERIWQAPGMKPIAERLSGSVAMKSGDGRPRFLVSLAGRLVQDVSMRQSRALVGRSAFCDILLEEKGISRQHALLLQDEDTLVLIDLRSRNGTLVNSRPVATKLLADKDIISIGNYRIKVDYPGVRGNAELASTDAADTARMQTIDDARRERLRSKAKQQVKKLL